MAKNIVLLSDGTGNSSANLQKTNVWRLFQILDLSNPAVQVAYYDDGVGTSSFKLFAILGGVFGFGLKRNVIAIYSFCCRNYQPGDRIYCFGFSRGSFTIRIVAAMIAYHGLVPYENNEAELGRFAADVYRLYRRRFYGGLLKFVRLGPIDLRLLRDVGIWFWRDLCRQRVNTPDPVRVESIHFVGIWDTVDAYGGPIEEMTRAIDYWVWPLSMPDRFMSAKVLRACHALSIEDERQAFRPVIWDQRYLREIASVQGEERHWLVNINHDPRSPAAKAAEPAPFLRTQLPQIDQQRISQVWFTGVHADVGGGYPQDGLSYVTLDWMLDRAEAYGLRYFNAQRKLLFDPQINPNDKLNDSRRGLAGYYRYKPRNIREIYTAPAYKATFREDVRRIWRMLCRQPDPMLDILNDLKPGMLGPVPPPPRATIHESVFERIKDGPDRYAPVVIPATKAYNFTGRNGAIADGPHPVDPGLDRSQVQNDVWEWIWLRRVVYFLTAFATLFVASIPVFAIYFPDFGQQSVGAFVVPIVNAGTSFLPNFLEPWFVAFRAAPGFVLIGVIAVAALLHLGGSLQRKIRDVARIAWHSPAPYRTRQGWHAFIHWLRRLGIYHATFYVLAHWVFPTGIMLWLFWWLAFGAANTLGLVCRPAGHVVDVTEREIRSPKSTTYPEGFETSNLCYPTSLKVSRGESYQIKLVVTKPWLDDTIPASPAGVPHSTPAQLAGIPFKRLIWSNWFAPIVRVGGSGLEEHLPFFEEVEKDHWVGQFKAVSDGEVFVYVNDTSIFLPWLYSAFYKNNHGRADIFLKKNDAL